MKKHLEIQSLSPEQFRRLTGVKRKTFEEMVLILREEQNKRYRKAGRKGLLSLKDKLLMTLEPVFTVIKICLGIG